jgi:hypothetical protein
VQDDYIIHLIWHAIIAVASPLFFVFMALKHHTASRWIRCVFILLAIVGVLWGILGVLRFGYPAHFTRAARASFDHFDALCGGFALGLLTSLLLSAEFWQLSRRQHSSSNQSLEPTADRCTETLKDDL